MKQSSCQYLRSVSLAAALVLVAGSAAPVLAEAQPKLSTAATRAGVTLSLGGKAIRTTTARIANARTITFAGSSKVVAVWDEYNGAQRSSWSALSLDGQRFGEAQLADPRVRLMYAQFDPLAQPPNVPAALSATPDNELWLVQFVSTPVDEMRRDIAAVGGVVERYVPDNVHVIRMDAAAKARVAALPYVRWVGAYEPAYRLSEDARRDVLEAGPDAGSARYSIECMRSGPVQQAALADLVTQMGGIVDTTTPDQYRMEVTVTPARLVQIAQRNEVNFIDPWYGPGGTDMNLIRQTGGAVPLLSSNGFLGQGVRGEIFDTGVVPNHVQWAGQTPLTHNTTALDSHGNACYGINFATGTGDANATGMNPQREQGIFCYYNNTSQFGGGPTRLTLNTEAVNPALAFRSCYQTSSVGSAQVTTYTTISAEVDDYLFRVDYLSCQSQSNLGNRSSRPQAWAKNIVSIGGLDLRETIPLDDDIKASGASVGPAQDLRVKPDLSHSYGLMVYTTYSTSATGYGQFNGTSSATPISAGHFGLLHQMWHEGVFTGFGGGASVFADRPKSTTAKALMINGAYRYPINQTSTGTPFTNSMYRGYVGWGLPYLVKLYNDRAKFFIVNWGDPLTQGQVRSYPLTVAAGEPEFRATMIFPDPQGNPAAAQQRINDLSLKVTDPNGIVYWGNNGMIATAISGAGQTAGANWSVAGGTANTVDTVENVFVQNPVAGTWTVEVIASQIVADGYLATAGVNDAVYSLVVANVTTSTPTPCYPNCDGSTIAPCLNVVDFNCFLNRYAVGDTYANCDNSTIVPVLNALDFACFLNSFAAGCSNC